MNKLLVLVVVLMTITTVNAQLGSALKKNLKGNGGSKDNKNAAMIYNPNMPVSLDFKYVINDIELDADGFLNHRFIKVTFPPIDDAAGPIDYKNKARMFIQLTKEGTEVFKLPCWEQNTNTTYKVFIPESNSDYARSIDHRVTEGKYCYNYFLDDSLFYSIDFEVKALKSTDPYDNNPVKYMIDGPWNKLAYINTASDDGRLEFNTYIRHEDVKALPQCNYWIELLKDGKVIAATDEPGKKGNNYVGNVTCKWKEEGYAIKMLVNGKLTANYASTKTLTDGNYTLKSSFDGKEFKYSFSMKDGKVIPAGDQVFSNEIASHYIEGMGKNFFFVKN